MAAGLSLKTENLRPFIDSLNKFASEHSNYRSEPPNLEIDAVVLPEELTLENVARISDLEPYGTGNPQPVICVRNLRIAQCSKVGDQGKHLKFSFYRDLPDGRRIYLDGVAFSQGVYEAMARSITDVCSVVCKVELNEWMGKQRVSLLVSDVFDGDYTVEHGVQCVYNDDYVTCRGFAVDRGKLAVLYKQLLSYGDSFKFSDLYQIRRNIRRLGAECTWYEIRNGIDIFTELGLVRRKDKQNFSIAKQSGKLELTSSNIYCRAQVKG